MLFAEDNFTVVDGLCSYTIPADPFKVQVPSSSSDAAVEHAVSMNLDPELVHVSLDGLESSSWVGSLRAFPPPLFSRQGIPQGYKCVIVSVNPKFTLMPSWKL